jgi:hypothetical protein
MADVDGRVERLRRLEPFVGEWRMEAPAFPVASEPADAARVSFEWTLGGAFLLQRSSIPVPEAPDGLSVIAPDAGRDSIQGRWEASPDGQAWELDFELTYRRVG